MHILRRMGVFIIQRINHTMSKKGGKFQKQPEDTQKVSIL
jgi:hypothetical protein